jgi:hypothetical protein
VGFERQYQRRVDDELQRVWHDRKDEAGNSRVTQTDGLGRLTAVWEDPGSSPHFNYETTYGYDVLDDLVQVNQGSEVRTFSYDSMKRLISSVQPESERRVTATME